MLRYHDNINDVWELNGDLESLTPTSAYTVTNHSDDRALNETGDTLVQVANVLGTLINDLKAGKL